MNILIQLKKTFKLVGLALGISAMLICSVSATNAFKGDEFFQNDDFDQARTAYMAAVETGSPHIYYQLGTIYYKGLGTKPNYLSAVVWGEILTEKPKLTSYLE